MATAGYSGTPLIKKLGITDNTKLFVLHAPPNYSSLLEKEISQLLCKKASMADIVHLFAASEKIFIAEMVKLQKTWEENTSLTIWVSWYKKAAGMNSDLTEDIIRNYALANGLVDIKVCAVSELWSGLKLVVPVIKRRPPPTPPVGGEGKMHY